MTVHAINSSLKIFISLPTKLFIAYISHKTVIIYLHSNNRLAFLRETPCFVTDKVLSYYFEQVNVPLEFFFVSQQPLLNIEVSWTHSDIPQSVGLLWTSDQPDAETSTWQHITRTTDRHPCHRRDSNPQSQQASGRRITPEIVWPHTRNTYFPHTEEYCLHLFTSNKIPWDVTYLRCSIP